MPNTLNRFRPAHQQKVLSENPPNLQIILVSKVMNSPAKVIFSRIVPLTWREEELLRKGHENIRVDILYQKFHSRLVALHRLTFNQP